MSAHILELGRPSVARPVLLWFLDPKLVPRKITFFHPWKEQKLGKLVRFENCWEKAFGVYDNNQAYR